MNLNNFFLRIFLFLTWPIGESIKVFKTLHILMFKICQHV